LKYLTTSWASPVCDCGGSVSACGKTGRGAHACHAGR
jgi:hypothetical protein